MSRICKLRKKRDGKSTLLELIAEELRPQKGTVWVSDQTRIGYFGQTNISRLQGDLTVEEEIASNEMTLSNVNAEGIPEETSTY